MALSEKGKEYLSKRDSAVSGKHGTAEQQRGEISVFADIHILSRFGNARADGIQPVNVPIGAAAGTEASVPCAKLSAQKYSGGGRGDVFVEKLTFSVTIAEILILTNIAHIDLLKFS